MKIKFSKDLLKYNKERERHGLPSVNRREFLKIAAMVAAGISSPVALGWNVSHAGKTEGILTPVPCPVGMVGGEDVEKMVRQAVNMAGGVEEIQSGQTVVIKPNCVAGVGFGGTRITTSIDVLRTVIRIVKEQTDASNITVADRSAWGISTLQSADAIGLLRLCKAENVKFLAWERAGYVAFSSPKFSHLSQAQLIPKGLDAFDHFINVPVLKNHEEVTIGNVDFTCCMKNFVGIMEVGTRSSQSNNIHTRDIGEKVAELGLFVPKITMNIVDALTVIVQHGPGGRIWTAKGPEFRPMVKANAGLILASKDRVACDSMALAVLKHYAREKDVKRSYVTRSVWEQSQIKHGAEIGLGLADPQKIRLLNKDVSNLDGIMAQWV